MDVAESESQVIERLRRKKVAAEEEAAREGAEISELGLRLEAAERELAELRRENDDLRRQLKDALEKIEALTRAAARQAAPFRRRDELKSDEKKPPGAKPGHRGRRRPRPPQVDYCVEVPLPACPSCGGPVGNRTPLTQYIEELPIVRPEVTRLTTWSGVCPQCGVVHSSHPLQTSRAGGAAKVQLGPRMKAFATLVNKQIGVPLAKTCAILRRAFGLSLSPGGLAQLEQRLAEKMTPAYDALKDEVRHSDAVYMDETSWYVGDPHWVLWVCTAPQFTVYHVDASHGGPVVDKLLGRDYEGVVVSDCHAAYRHLERAHKCIAHHLQALKKYRVLNGTRASTTYLDDWKQLWLDVLALTRERNDLPPEAELPADWSDRKRGLEARWEELLAREPTAAGDRKFLGRMVHTAPHHFGCLEYRVEGTNNRAERAIRPAVVARKVSCGNKTERGARTWQVLVSLAVTAAQCGRDFLQEAVAAITPRTRVPAG